MRKPVLRSAIAMQGRVVAAGGSRMMALTNDLALTLNDLGRYQEAAEMLARSDKAMADIGLGKIDAAISWTNRAGILENAGDYAASLKALDTAIALLDEDHVEPRNQSSPHREFQARTFGREGMRIGNPSGLRLRCSRIEGGIPALRVITWQCIAGRANEGCESRLPLLDEARAVIRAGAANASPFAHALRAGRIRVRGHICCGRPMLAGHCSI